MIRPDDLRLERARLPGNEAVSVIKRLKKRAEFMNAAKGRRFTLPLFTLQAVERRDPIFLPEASRDEAPRLGFTVTKKCGNSVERNRIRRRLKGALAHSAPDLRQNHLVKPRHDYVLIARRGAISAPFAILKADLTSAFAGVHRQRTSAKARAGVADAPGGQADLGQADLGQVDLGLVGRSAPLN